MSSEPQRERLPFEPSGNRSKPPTPATETNSEPKAAKPKSKSATTGQKSAAKSAPVAAAKSPTLKSVAKPSVPKATDKAKRDTAQSIPKVVSNRMARRMAVFSGIPTALGCLTFVASYVVVTQQWLELPNTAVVLVSMACFGLGVLGLSYGVLSASWEESTAGSLFGWSEFNTNVGRMAEAWRASKQNKQSSD